jgi:hypothetical protein
MIFSNLKPTQRLANFFYFIQNACKHSPDIWFGNKRAGSQVIYDIDDMCLPVLLVIYFIP